jgi:allantoinase
MNTQTVVVRNGSVVTPAGLYDLDIVIRDERIDALVRRGAELPTADDTIDAEGHVVLPGAIDGHTHFVQDDTALVPPDPIEHEGFTPGGRGAAVGGVTTHVEMPQARPPTTDGATFRRKRELAEPDAIVDFALWGGVVQGQEPSAIDEQIEEGAAGFKAFMCDSDPSFPGVDDVQLLDTLQKLAETPLMLGVHAENDALLRAGIERLRSSGRKDPLAHAESRPPIVEIEAVTRAITFAEYTRAWVHIVHMSTRGAADAVAEARARGVRVTCETCPQYLALDHDDLQLLGPFARCAPPIRSRHDVERLWEGLADGTIDCITTDHCAFTYESRLPGHEDIFEAPNGLPGIQTFLPVFITEARRRGFTWERIAELVAGTPARLWHLAPRKGSIAEGADADLVLLDPERTWTIVRGVTVYDDTGGTPMFAPAGTGRFVPALVPTPVGGR